MTFPLTACRIENIEDPFVQLHFHLAGRETGRVTYEGHTYGLVEAEGIWKDQCEEKIPLEGSVTDYGPLPGVMPNDPLQDQLRQITYLTEVTESLVIAPETIQTDPMHSSTDMATPANEGTSCSSKMILAAVLVAAIVVGILGATHVINMHKVITTTLILGPICFGLYLLQDIVTNTPSNC